MSTIKINNWRRCSALNERRRERDSTETAREPSPVGELLAEAVRPDLPSVFVAGASTTASGLMSYDLLLRRVLDGVGA